MVTNFWGKKIGMAQVFVENNVVPVTVIDTGSWYVTQVKTQEHDGYDAVQVGLVKERFANTVFSNQWLSKSKNYFQVLREIRLQGPCESQVGDSANYYQQLVNGDHVDVFGITKGAGFAGCVRRHGFAGSRASHGAMMGKRPGSLGFMRSRGRVIKGKKLPGHMGVNKRMMGKLEVVRVEPDSQIVLVKGSVPGKAGSLVFIRKA
jgi:large subunit ribosomal protein L3